MAGTTIVDTTHGRIEGENSDDGVAAFLGAPYGASTEGAGRFLPPRPVEPWTGLRSAVTYGAPAPQAPHVDFIGGPPLTMPGMEAAGEACLVQNIWTPGLDAVRRPVFVWWHGGAWAGGVGSLPGMCEGAAMAKRNDVVVVTVNHRLNLFGHLQLGEAFGDDYRASGNVGMLDLAASLEWVRDNIESFGGDPDRVTIFGTSGGGAKVATALAMPTFRGLFHAAIVQSGHDLWKPTTLDTALRYSERFLAELGVAPGDVRQLQELPADALLGAYAAMAPKVADLDATHNRGWVKYDWFAPVIDGELLPAHVLDGRAASVNPSVPVIIGNERYDHWNPMGMPGASLGYPVDFGAMSFEAVHRRLQPFLGARANGFVATYRTTRPGLSPSALLATIMTDRDWRVPALRLAEARVGTPNAARTYVYNSSGPHAADLMFDAPMMTPPYFTGPGRALLEQVPPAWRNFATTGDPNHSLLPTWEPYELPRRPTMLLGIECEQIDDPWSTERRLWESRGEHE